MSNGVITIAVVLVAAALVWCSLCWLFNPTSDRIIQTDNGTYECYTSNIGPAACYVVTIYHDGDVDIKCLNQMCELTAAATPTPIR